jgi:hypothetical protein
VTSIDGGLRIAFTCDALDEDWPYLLVRDLPIEDDERLDALLAKRLGSAPEDDLATIFQCAPLEVLVRLVLNAILYATSADAKTEERPPPAPRERGARRDRGFVSSEHVHYLPGTIDITALRAVQRVRRGAVDAEQTHRCMVRGHWRRAVEDGRRTPPLDPALLAGPERGRDHRTPASPRALNGTFTRSRRRSGWPGRSRFARRALSQRKIHRPINRERWRDRRNGPQNGGRGNGRPARGAVALARPHTPL